MLRGIADRPLLVTAFDGPLRADLETIDHYRLAEQMLTRQFQPRIGKPGQSSSPVGRKLNDHANQCAKVILGTGKLRTAKHDHAIHKSAIVEAFPTSFLGMLVEEPENIPALRANRSDNFYRYLDQTGALLGLLHRLLPRRKLLTAFNTITNHDERAAVVCALTALCVAVGNYTAVGDDKDGWIVLPPRSFIKSWARVMLDDNAQLSMADGF